MSTDKDFLYEEIAVNIKKNIEKGALRLGEKLKSVRMLSKELGVSQTTIFHAYFELESEGLIESRPKSGYYVRNVPKQNNNIPSPTNTIPEVAKVTNQELIHEVVRKKYDAEVIDLSMATPAPSLLPIAKLKKSIQKAYLKDDKACTSYEDFNGNLALRRQVAKLSMNWSQAFNEDDIIITAGCQEAIALALKAVTKPGDTVVMESPVYFGIIQVIESLHLKVIEIDADPLIGVSPTRLKDILENNKVAAIVVVPNFNNPVGSCMPDTSKKKLAEMAAKYQVPLIEDDIYGEIYYSHSRPKTCKSFDKEGWVIYCSSVSKTLAPGFRMGWCIPGRFKSKISHLKFTHNITTSSIPQMALADFLENGRYELHLKKFRKALHLQSYQYAEALFKHLPREVRFTSPRGGYVFWIELPQHIDTLNLYYKAFEQKIIIAPGQIFTANATSHNYFRLSYGNIYSESIEQGLKKLGKMIAAEI